MRRTVILAVLLTLALLLTGCPFESTVPIGDPEAGSLDSRLTGLWFWTDPTTGSVTEFHILQFNSSEYYVETLEEYSVTGRFRMYIVTVGGQPFLSINDITEDDEPGSFLFARYSVSETDGLSLRFVGDDAIPESLASDPKALIDFIAAHLDGDVLDDPDGPFMLSRSMPEEMPGDIDPDR